MSPTNHAVSYFYFHRLSAISLSLVSVPGLKEISTTHDQWFVDVVVLHFNIYIDLMVCFSFPFLD